LIWSQGFDAVVLRAFLPVCRYLLLSVLLELVGYSAALVVISLDFSDVQPRINAALRAPHWGGISWSQSAQLVVGGPSID